MFGCVVWSSGEDEAGFGFLGHRRTSADHESELPIKDAYALPYTIRNINGSGRVHCGRQPHSQCIMHYAL